MHDAVRAALDAVATRKPRAPIVSAGAKLLTVTLDFWRAHVVGRVPDPGVAQGSSYDTNVEWFVAVRELNPAASEALLTQWATQHKNRKNLRKAMAARKMPVPAGVTRPKH